MTTTTFAHRRILWSFALVGAGLILALSGGTAHADQPPSASWDSAHLGTEVGYACNPGGHRAVVRSDGKLLYTRGGTTGLAVSVGTWNSSSLTWTLPNTTSAAIVTASNPSPYGWSIDADATNGWVAEDLNIYKIAIDDSSLDASLPSGATTFDAEAAGDAYHPDVLRTSTRIYVAYVFVNGSTKELRYAYSTDGNTWSHATLATSGVDIDQGVTLFPWIASGYDAGLIYQTTSGTLDLWRLNGATKTHSSSFAAPTSSASLSVPSVASDGTALHLLVDDATSGLVYRKGTIVSGSLSWSTAEVVATPSQYTSDSCTNAPSGSIMFANDVPVTSYVNATDDKFKVAARIDGSWQTIQVDPDSGLSQLEPPSFSRSSYSSAVPLAFSDDGTSTNNTFIDTVLLPTKVSSPTAAPAAGVNAEWMTIGVAAAPSDQTVTITYPDSSTASGTCDSATGSPLTVACSWTPPGSSAEGTYSADVTLKAPVIAGSATKWLKHVLFSFLVDHTGPCGGSITCTLTLSATSEPTIYTTPDSGWTHKTDVNATWGGGDALSGVTRVYLSNTSTRTSPQQIVSPSCTTSCPGGPIAWALPSGEGNKTVYMWLGDAAGNVSSPATAVIGLDLTNPQVTSVGDSNAVYDSYGNIYVGASDINGLNWFTVNYADPPTAFHSGVWHLSRACDDPNNSAAYDFVAVTDPSSTARSCAFTGEGLHRVDIRPFDHAGNYASSLLTQNIIVDLTAPTLTFNVPSTADRTFTLNWSSLDPKTPDLLDGSGVTNYDVEVKRSDQSTFSTVPGLTEPTTATSVTFTGSEPYTYAFRIRVRDRVANVSAWVQRTIQIVYAPLTTTQLGSVDGHYLCDAAGDASELAGSLCNTILPILPINPSPPLPLNGATVGSIALVSSGIDCAGLPAGAQAQIVGCATLTDTVGYGTWAASVILQANPNATIQSYNVFRGKQAADDLVSTALSQIRTQGGFNAVLLAFPPSNVLDPTSWALQQPFNGYASSNIGSVWDEVTQAIVDHPYDANGTNISAFPLNDSLRAQMFSTLDPRQRAAIDSFAARTKTWQAIHQTLKEITAAGTPVVIGTGEGVGAPTQSIVGIAALPEVITVGPSWTDADGVTDRLTKAAARGPAPDISMKPDFLANSQIAGLVPIASPLHVLSCDSLTTRPGLLATYNTATLTCVNAGWSVPAAAATAVDAADLVGQGLAAADPSHRAAEVKGLLRTVASTHQARKSSGSTVAAAWEQGSGVLFGANVPNLSSWASIPIPISGSDIGQVPAGSSGVGIDFSFRSTCDIVEGLLCTPATNSGVTTTSPSAMRFLGPSDGGVALETNYSGTSDVSITTPSSYTTHLVADTGTGNADVFQGGLYCFTITSSPYQWPSCLVRDRKVKFRSDYLRTDPSSANAAGERTEKETFILTPGFPLKVGVLGMMFKYVPLDPSFVPLGVKETDSNGLATLSNVPPAMYRLLHLGSYDAQGTYGTLDDPTLTPGAGFSDLRTDTWVYRNAAPPATGTTWEDAGTRTSPPTVSPTGRFGAASAYDQSRNRLVVFGGQDSSGSALADTYEWDGSNWAKKSPAQSPSARAGAAMYYDPRFSKVVLFGGKDASGIYLNDFWSYDGTTWIPGASATVTTLASNFTPRAFASIAYDSTPSGGRAVLVGGRDASGPVSSTNWLWDGTATGWVAGPTGPSARYGAGLAFDDTTGRKLSALFGGIDGSGNLLGDTWELKYDTSLTPAAYVWSQPSLTNSPPAPPKGLAQMSYVPSAGPAGPGVLMFEYSRNWSKLWKYDGQWTDLTPPDRSLPFPYARAYGVVAYDTNKSQLVLTGGIVPKLRGIGLTPGAVARFVEIPARTSCAEATSPLGPLTGTETLLNAAPGVNDYNTAACVDATRILDSWDGSQTKTQTDQAATAGDTFCPLALATGAAGLVTENVYCSDVASIAVPEGVMTRYVDLIHARDYDYCGAVLPSSTDPSTLTPDTALQIVSQMSTGATCAAPSSTETNWSYAQNGPNCDPDGTDAAVTGTYGFRSPTNTSNPDLVLGGLHYRFTIPSPNYYARLRVNLQYDLRNADIAIVATTGSVSSINYGPPQGGIIFPQQPQVTVTPSSASSAVGGSQRGMLSSEFFLWPNGATTGDLYIIFTPTTWVGPVSSQLATASVCKASFDLDTFGKTTPVFSDGIAYVQANVDPGGDLFTRQLLATPSSKTWTRRNWNPSANGGLGAWAPVATENETIQVDYQVPRDWDPSLSPPNAGQLVYASDVTGDSASHPSLQSSFPSGQFQFDDLNKGVLTGKVDNFVAATTIDSINSLLTSGDLTDPTKSPEWAVNGRFAGLLNVPEPVLRANPTLDLELTLAGLDGNGEANPPNWDDQGAPWAGQAMGATSREGADGYQWNKSGGVWSKNSTYLGDTRYAQAFFTPYFVPTTTAFRVNGMIFTLDASNSHLRIEMNSTDVGDPVSVDIDLTCATTTPGLGCAGHSP